MLCLLGVLRACPRLGNPWSGGGSGELAQCCPMMLFSSSSRHSWTMSLLLFQDGTWRRGDSTRQKGSFLLAQFYPVLMPFWCVGGKYGHFSLGLFFNVSQRMLFLGISLCSLTLLGLTLLRSPLSPFLSTLNSFLGRAFSLQALLAGQGSFRVDSVWLLCPEPTSETLEILKVQMFFTGPYIFSVVSRCSK